MFVTNAYPEMITELAHQRIRELEHARRARQARAQRRAARVSRWTRLLGRSAD
jgi:hypothetical protein